MTPLNSASKLTSQDDLHELISAVTFCRVNTVHLIIAKKHQCLNTEYTVICFGSQYLNLYKLVSRKCSSRLRKSSVFIHIYHYHSDQSKHKMNKCCDFTVSSNLAVILYLQTHGSVKHHIPPLCCSVRLFFYILKLFWQPLYLSLLT